MGNKKKGKWVLTNIIQILQWNELFFNLITQVDSAKRYKYNYNFPLDISYRQWTSQPGKLSKEKEKETILKKQLV